MTRRVDQYDITRARALQPLQHRFEKQPVSDGVVVGVALELQSATAKERRMVAPGRIAQMNHGGRRDGADQLGAHAQRAAAAGSLRGPCAAHRKGRVGGPSTRVSTALLYSSRPAAAT